MAGWENAGAVPIHGCQETALTSEAKQRSQDWRFLMVLFAVSTFLELTAWGHLQAFTPLYLKDELGVSAADVPRWTGILASSSLVIALPLSPFWGVLADRYSRKAVIVRAQLVEALAFGLVSVCTDPGQLLAVRLLLGFSYGNLAVAMATQSMLTPDRQVGTAIGIIQMASTVATSTGPFLGSLVINTLGMRAMFAIDAVTTLIAAIMVTFLFREPPLHDRSTPLGAKLRVVFEQVTRVPPIRWNFLCWFLIYAATAAMDPFLPVAIDRLSEGVDSATLIGALLGAYGLLTALGTPAMGRLADRVGAARLFLVAAPALTFVAAGIALSSSLGLLALLVILRAVPQAGTAVVLYSHLAAHVPTRHRAAVMSLTPMPRNAAWLLAPGMAAAATGLGLSGAFWLAAALFCAATFVAVLMVGASGRVARAPEVSES